MHYLLSFLQAHKFYDDCFLSNGSVAKIGGIPVKELNILEIKFLESIEFDLFLSPEFYSLAKKFGIEPKKIEATNPDTTTAIEVTSIAEADEKATDSVTQITENMSTLQIVKSIEITNPLSDELSNQKKECSRPNTIGTTLAPPIAIPQNNNSSTSSTDSGSLQMSASSTEFSITTPIPIVGLSRSAPSSSKY